MFGVSYLKTEEGMGLLKKVVLFLLKILVFFL